MPHELRGLDEQRYRRQDVVKQRMNCMARVKIEEVVDHLSSEFTAALLETFRKHAPDAQINQHQAFRDFKSAVYRKCSTWERVPDRYVEPD
jgi:hypothetical protein